jgi:polysaccharide biosynthesis transport protein
MWFMWRNGSQEVHLADYLRVIRKRFPLILWITLASLTFVFILNQVVKPVYRAETRLLVEEKLQDVNLTQNMLLPYRKEFLGTQVQILESNPVFEASIRELGLENELPESTPFSALIKRLKGLLGLTYRLSEAQAKRNSMEKAIAKLKKQVALESMRGTNIIRLQVEGENPETVAKVANSLARQFIGRSLYLRNKDSFEASHFLKGQVGEVQTTLGLAEKRLEEFQFSEEAISLDKRIDFLVENQIIVSEKELEDVMVSLEEERERVEVLHSQVSKERGKKSAGDRGTLKFLTEQQLGLELRLEELKRKFTDKHPDVIALKKSLDLLKRRLDSEESSSKSGKQQASSDFLQSLEAGFSEAQRQYRVLSVREAELARHLEAQKEKLRTLLKKKSRFLVLQRDLKVNEKLYEVLLRKEKEVGVEATLNVGHVKQVQEATLPVYPIRPRKALNLVLALFSGFLLGVGLAFMFEYMDRTLKTREEITAIMEGVPLLGVLHQEELLKKDSHLMPTLTLTNPNSFLGEAFKILRSNLQLLLESDSKVYLVTSSLPSEGKTTVVSNLGISFARTGKKVLIVDLDLRRPKLHNFFQGSEPENGVFKTEIEGLSVWKAPQVKDHTLYIESSAFHQQLDALSLGFDLVLLDTAPLNLVSDTGCLLRRKIPILLVIGAGYTTREQVQRARELIGTLGGDLPGYIISRLDEGEVPSEYHAYYEEYSG